MPSLLPERIRVLRRTLNLSQEELAARLNISFATVNRWENGKAEPQQTQADAIEALFQEANISQEAGELDLFSGHVPEGAGGTRRRRGTKASAVLSNRTMEQMLWDAAWRAAPGACPVGLMERGLHRVLVEEGYADLAERPREQFLFPSKPTEGGSPRA